MWLAALPSSSAVPHQTIKLDRILKSLEEGAEADSQFAKRRARRHPLVLIHENRRQRFDRTVAVRHSHHGFQRKAAEGRDRGWRSKRRQLHSRQLANPTE